jgi:undecaprenyl-phosphate 4-deoxy-4-formamido-L-arabinose transferase
MKDGELPPALSIVVPVYRSEACLAALVAAIDDALTPAGITHEIVLVNDFSPDRSWAVIESLCARLPHVVGIDLRRNFGQDNAIMTGMRVARGRFVAIMDDDLQHHPRDLPALLAKAEEGFDVVYADFRRKRHKLWKNLGSWFNGRVAEWVIEKPRHIYLSPYKVIRGDVAALVCEHIGPDPYVDGLLLQLTARITQVPVEHHDRFAGEGTYTFWKSVGVWARLAVSFSPRPLRLVTWFGFAFAALGFLLSVAVVAYRLARPQVFTTETAGWASLMVATLMVGGIQMILFGVLGEYIGRTFLKANRKPQTSIRAVLGGAARGLAVAKSREIRPNVAATHR